VSQYGNPHRLKADCMIDGSLQEGHATDETWLMSALLKLQSQVWLFGWQWQTTSY
jgi:hypothetical protein